MTEYVLECTCVRVYGVPRDHAKWRCPWWADSKLQNMYIVRAFTWYTCSMCVRVSLIVSCVENTAYNTVAWQSILWQTRHILCTFRCPAHVSRLRTPLSPSLLLPRPSSFFVIFVFEGTGMHHRLQFWYRQYRFTAGYMYIFQERSFSFLCNPWIYSTCFHNSILDGKGIQFWCKIYPFEILFLIFRYIRIQFDVQNF